MRLVSSGGKRTNASLPKAATLAGPSVASSSDFQQNVDRLRGLRPAFVSTIERLVADALRECESDSR